VPDQFVGTESAANQDRFQQRRRLQIAVVGGAENIHRAGSNHRISAVLLKDAVSVCLWGRICQVKEDLKQFPVLCVITHIVHSSGRRVLEKNRVRQNFADESKRRGESQL
jgi:hypothetical protein